MSEFSKPRRTRNLYKSGQSEPFKISRSKIDLFLECPRCFYMDRVLGVSRPAGFPFNLNSAVDHLLKKEFDIHRAKETTHPLMRSYGIDAVPFIHEDIDEWRENFKGLQHHDKDTNLIITGAIDDIWKNYQGELHVVDYKATSKDSEINLDANWQDGYKRQVEVYQWLLRQKDFKVSNTAYFVYANGQRDREAFDGKLEFDVKIIPYVGDDSWVGGTILKLKKCMDSEKVPDVTRDCDYCLYTEEVKKV